MKKKRKEFIPDDSHVSSEDELYGDRSIRDSQALPAFDNLPSVRSKISDSSMLKFSARKDNGGGGEALTKEKLDIFNKYKRQGVASPLTGAADPVFDNLPSMKSSVAGGNTDKKSNRKFDLLQRFSFKQDDLNPSEQSYSQASYKINLGNQQRNLKQKKEALGANKEESKALLQA